MNAMNQQQKKDLALEQWAEKYDIELESVLPYYSLYVMAHAFKNTEYGRRMARQRFKLTDEPADNRKLVTLLKDLESYRVQCDKCMHKFYLFGLYSNHRTNKPCLFLLF